MTSLRILIVIGVPLVFSITSVLVFSALISAMTESSTRFFNSFIQAVSIAPLQAWAPTGFFPEGANPEASQGLKCISVKCLLVEYQLQLSYFTFTL